MSFQGRRLQLGLSAVVVAAAVCNALALWGPATAQRVQFVLEAALCAGALLVGVVVVARASGLSRWWRVSLLSAIATFLAAESLAHLVGGTHPGGAAPAPAVVGYFVAGLLFCVAMLLLVRAGRNCDVPTPARGWPAVITTILDGLVSTLAFCHLLYVARLGAIDGAALPRSTNTEVVWGIAGVELITVVGAVLLAMWYPPYRPGRANYMLLAAAVITLASSDRLLAYLQSVGVTTLNLWVGIGFVLAPLFIVWSLLVLPPRPRPPRRRTGHELGAAHPALCRLHGQYHSAHLSSPGRTGNRRAFRQHLFGDGVARRDPLRGGNAGAADAHRTAC